MDADIQARIGQRDWFHSIEVAPGIVTPGRVPLEHLRALVRRCALPDSLAGLRVLDVGAWDGFFSFEAERRGAREVLALDVPPVDRKGFALARDLLGSRVRYEQGSVYDLSPARHGTFDLVLFLGVLYHLRHPLLALDRLRSVCDGYLLLESHVLDGRLIVRPGEHLPLDAIDARLAGLSLFQFYRNDELNGDFSNWFAPTVTGLAEALASAGFSPELLCRGDDRAVFKAQVTPGVPEYQMDTYDGLRYEPDEAGGVRTIWPRRPRAG